jgi:hypothetical protein
MPPPDLGSSIIGPISLHNAIKRRVALGEQPELIRSY